MSDHDVAESQWFDVRRFDNASIGTWENLNDAIEQAVRQYVYSHKDGRVLADDGTLIGVSGDFAPDGFRWDVTAGDQQLEAEVSDES